MAPAIGLAAAASALLLTSTPAMAKINEVTKETICASGQHLDPYEVWSAVGSDAEAEAFLKAKYEEIGDLEAFDDWLRCQGMRTNYFNNEVAWRLDPGEISITATFGAKAFDRPTLWGWRWTSWLGMQAWGQNFELTIGAAGEVRDVRVSYTFK